MKRHHRPAQPARARHKTAQLCRQAYRTLVAALADIDDDVLLDVTIDSVEPFPDATRLLVIARVPSGGSPILTEPIGRALDRHRGRLRADVARAITRKRAPELVFKLAIDPRGEATP